jgi:hypothetical protein
MTTLLGWWLLASLLVHVAAHVVLVAEIARKRRRWRAVAAFFVTPLAALWGWEAGARRAAIVWLAGLAAWVLAVAFAALR